VTVIDPRHPLFNRIFPLLHIKNKQEKNPRCLISLPEGVERWLPIEVTNLSGIPPEIFPIPIDLHALQTLAPIFLRFEAQLEQEGRNGSHNKTHPNGAGAQAPTSLGDTRGSATGAGQTNDDPDLPGNAQSMAPGGKR
jgi:hypothetical protein